MPGKSVVLPVPLSPAVSAGGGPLDDQPAPVDGGGNVIDQPSLEAVDIVVPIGSHTVAESANARSADSAFPVVVSASDAISVASGERASEAVPSADTPLEVRLTGMASEDALAAGLDGVAFGLSLVDYAPSGQAVVRVDIDYDSFRAAYGGDWAGRLQLVSLPGCAALTPELVGCRERTVLPSSNDLETGILTADLAVGDAAGTAGFGERRAGSPSTVYGLSAGYTSLSGSFAATPLRSASSWTVGTQMGSFNWSYPINVAPTGFGAAPSVSLDYSSQAIDGLTSDQNLQAGPVALGWNLSAGGFVERQYVPCVDEHPGSGELRQDMCWHSDNATISLNGKSAALIPTDVVDGDYQEFRLDQDPGWKVIRQRFFSDASVDGGETWYVYDPSGVEYRFGQRLEPTTGLATNSVWSLPVYGNDGDDPCFGVATACRQGWRWNLDWVRDRLGNVTTYQYSAETNRYRGGEYVRGGYLAEIRYGMREGSEGAYRNRVIFNMKDRCIARPATSTRDCLWADEAAIEDVANWPDVPSDLDCTIRPTCGFEAPSFWSAKALESVDTVVNGQVVDRVWFKTFFRIPGVDEDGVKQNPNQDQAPQLFVRTISHWAFPASGAPGVSADIRFEYDGLSGLLDNRAEPTIDALFWRITKIIGGLGGRTDVLYGQKSACATYDPSLLVPPVAESAFWSTQTQDCYRRWSILDEHHNQGFAVFNRYLVSTVTERDLVAGGRPITTTYTYEDTPAYHWDDSLVTPLEQKTWSEPRGYGDVAHWVGPDAAGQITKVRERYFRGMTKNIDAAGNQGPEVERVYEDGTRYNDLNNLRGMMFITQTIDTNSAGAPADHTVSYFPTGTQTAGPDQFGRGAWRMDQTRVEHRQRELGISYGPRIWNTFTTDDGYGFPIEVVEPGPTYQSNDKTYWTTCRTRAESPPRCVAAGSGTRVS